MLGYILFEL